MRCLTLFWLCISPSSWLLCCDPFAVCPSLSFQACQLLFEYVPWSLREEGVLGFPGLSQSHAGASATKLPCDSTLGAEGKEGQRPWALAGKGMGIKKWTKHHREQNIRVAWYIAECMFDFTTFQADVCRKQTIMRACLSLNIGSKKFKSFDNFPLPSSHSISALGRSTGLQGWEMWFFNFTSYRRIMKQSLGENLDKPSHPVLIWKDLHFWWFTLVFRCC